MPYPDDRPTVTSLDDVRIPGLTVAEACRNIGFEELNTFCQLMTQIFFSLICCFYVIEGKELRNDLSQFELELGIFFTPPPPNRIRFEWVSKIVLKLIQICENARQR